jgi:hypothetical protein
MLYVEGSGFDIQPADCPIWGFLVSSPFKESAEIVA